MDHKETMVPIWIIVGTLTLQVLGIRSSTTIGNWSKTPVVSQTTSSNTPKCQWESKKELNCNIRTLDDSFGTWVIRGNWLLFDNNHSTENSDPNDSFTSKPPVFSWSSNSNRGDVRQATTLRISCNKQLFYQSSLSAISFQVSLFFLAYGYDNHFHYILYYCM